MLKSIYRKSKTNTLDQTQSQNSIISNPKKRKISLVADSDKLDSDHLDVNDEISNFLNMNICVDENSNPLHFYKNNVNQFPILSKIVKKIFCLTASSVPCEQLFSKAGEVISNKRNRLKPELAEILTLLDQNYN